MCQPLQLYSEAQWNSFILLFAFHRNIVSTLNVTAGEYDLSQTEPGEQTLTIETVIIHPHFSTKKPMDYDIALLKMAGAFQFGKHLRIVLNCLPQILYNLCAIAHFLRYMFWVMHFETGIWAWGSYLKLFLLVVLEIALHGVRRGFSWSDK